MNNPVFKLFALLVCSLSVLGTFCQAQDTRQDPTARQLKTPNGGGKSNETNVVCDTNLPRMVEICARPLMDIIEGKMEKWPKNEKDTQELCDSFIATERCIKDVGRKCAKGLHKTIISTLAAAVQRSRKRECVKGRLPGLLKMTQCVEKNQVPMHNMISNITSHLLVIENQMPDVDQKTNSVCCMVHSIESDIRSLYQSRCASESIVILRMYNSILEDVTDLICRSPKCNDVFRGHRIQKTKTTEGIISILLRIVFSLGD